MRRSLVFVSRETLVREEAFVIVDHPDALDERDILALGETLANTDDGFALCDRTRQEIGTDSAWSASYRERMDDPEPTICPNGHVVAEDEMLCPHCSWDSSYP